MLELTESHQSVLERYSRAVVHMRRQVSENRFGLVLGAGTSKPFGIPTWGELVLMLAKDPEIQGEGVLQTVPPRAGLPYQTEMLFEHYRERRYAAVNAGEQHTRLLDFSIAADWRQIVRKHLYSSVKVDGGAPLDGHPYMKQYLPLIKASHMTVTYNFDDFIEQSILGSRTEQEKRSLGFESVTNPWTQFRRPTAVIYHPNGVVPQNVLETPSDRFVFSEASYAERLMGIYAGDQAGLLNHFSKHTCLLIGLSLEDDTLRSVLVQAARSCPGNFHYYVRYMPPGETLDEEKRRAIVLANFKVYNLVTLFLDDDGIRALGDLIDVERCRSADFCDFADVHKIRVRFRFYVTGPLGVGKSTTINHFRSLVVLDEWLEQRPAVLAEDWQELSADETKAADDWVIGQFRRKNDILRHEHEGIFALDRGPLDPLSFTPDSEWRSKASLLLATLCPRKTPWQVQDGRVILLEGDSEELALRMLLAQRKDYSGERLVMMGDRLSRAYGSEGVVRFDTTGLTPADVARRVAEIVYLEEYEPVCDLHDRLQEIQKNGVNSDG